jgi:hypothetical protein
VVTGYNPGGVLLSGNMALEFDDGAEVVLSPGDVLIENGTRHLERGRRKTDSIEKLG